MCVTCGILAGRRSAVGSSSERSSVCQPRCSRATSHQPRQPRQPECLSKQYICTFHSGYESRISKWFVTCCYSCFFRFESSSESIQASNLEAERMIWSHIESSYHGYGEFQGNLPGSVCWALNWIPVFLLFLSVLVAVETDLHQGTRHRTMAHHKDSIELFQHLTQWIQR